MRGLTQKQEKFVSGLIKGLSQREAYKKAGYSVKKSSDKTIDESASRLFKNTKVNARFKELSSKVVKKAEEKTIATALEVLQFYSDVMQGKEKDVAILSNDLGQMEQRKVEAQLKERLKAADALAKKYGLNEYNVNVESNQTVLDVSKLTKEQIKEMLKDE